MKKQSRKLSLNRETIAALQSDDLANVNGGVIVPITPTILRTTRPGPFPEPLPPRIRTTGPFPMPSLLTCATL
jgi:hypothetical protein